MASPDSMAWSIGRGKLYSYCILIGVLYPWRTLRSKPSPCDLRRVKQRIHRLLALCGLFDRHMKWTWQCRVAVMRKSGNGSVPNVGTVSAAGNGAFSSCSSKAASKASPWIIHRTISTPVCAIAMLTWRGCWSGTIVVQSPLKYRRAERLMHRPTTFIAFAIESALRYSTAVHFRG